MHLDDRQSEFFDSANLLIKTVKLSLHSALMFLLINQRVGTVFYYVRFWNLTLLVPSESHLIYKRAFLDCDEILGDCFSVQALNSPFR